MAPTFGVSKEVIVPAVEPVDREGSWFSVMVSERLVSFRLVLPVGSGFLSWLESSYLKIHTNRKFPLCYPM